MFEIFVNLSEGLRDKGENNDVDLVWSSLAWHEKGENST